MEDRHIGPPPESPSPRVPESPSPQGTRELSPWKWLALVVVLLLAFISPLRRDLFIGDETKYGRVVQQMTETHSYMVLEKDGEVYGHKPPVHFWLIALLTRLFGLESIWPFVLPSLVSFVVLCLLVRRWHDGLLGQSGLLAAIVFCTFWLAWISGQTARMDMLFALLISAAAVQFFGYETRGEWRPALLAGFLTGLAVLVKGPMALAVIAMLVLIESIRSRRRPGIPVLAGGAIAVVVPLFWLIPAIRTGGEEYGRELILKQTLGRAFQSWVHGEPPWFYLERFPLTFFPWFLVLIIALVVAFRGIEIGRPVGFLSSWFLSALVPFFLISAKLDVYMLPAMVPGAMLVAWLLTRLGGATERRWIRKSLMAVTTILVFVPVLALGGLGLSRSDSSPDLELARDPRVVFALVISTVALVAGAAAIRRLGSGTGAGLAFGVACLALPAALIVVATPVLNGVASTRPLANAIVESGIPPESIALYWTPHVWTRDMDPALHRLRYLEEPSVDADPAWIVVRRDKAVELEGALSRYRVVRSIRMIGKEFDVYERQ